MIGQSDRVSKMTGYHRFADKIDRAHKALFAKAKSFVTHVEACLPPGREKWWTAFSPHKWPEEDGAKENGAKEDGAGKSRAEATQTGPEAARMGAREALTEALMFEVAPYSQALRCTRRLDEPWTAHRAQRSVKSSSSVLKSRAELVLDCRERYLKLILQEDRIRRTGEWDWYETVRTVRNAAWTNDLCPLLQVNRLQATFQNGVGPRAGFPEAFSSSLGEAALEGLAARNRRPGGPRGSDTERWNDLPLEESKIEDALWALYLSIASGDPVPGAYLDAGSPSAPPTNGSCVTRN